MARLFSLTAIWLQFLLIGFSYATLSCPSSNGTVYKSGNYNFLVQCGIDHDGGTFQMIYNNTFSGCIDACAPLSNCISVSYSGAACYMKSTVGTPVYNGVWSATLDTKLSSSSSGASSTASSYPAFSSTASSSANRITSDYSLFNILTASGISYIIAMLIK